MKKRILLILLAIPLTLGIIGIYKNAIEPESTVRAFGSLTVTYLGVPLGVPVFTVNNMAPGDPPQIRIIDVSNSGSVARYIAIKGNKTGGIGGSPLLEEALKIEIKEGATSRYGAGGSKTLKTFFDESSSLPNGIPLSVVGASGSTSYSVIVTFPSTADNNFQNKSVIFDLTFGVVTGDNIVINEVYYKVDSKHGIDSYKDRGSLKNDKQKGNDDEWIELFNPTANNISLKDWTLEDNSGKKIIIHSNSIIKKNGFALIAKDASMWKYWKVAPDAVKIQSTDFLGDGLDNSGDHLILRNAVGTTVDQVGWGIDKVVWNPAVSNVALGSSIERIVPGFDTDSPTDWHEVTFPTPGN